MSKTGIITVSHDGGASVGIATSGICKENALALAHVLASIQAQLMDMALGKDENNSEATAPSSSATPPTA